MKDTPRYEILTNEIEKNYRYIDDKLENCKIYYAMKANSEEGVIRELDKLGSCFECSSKEEFDLLKKLNVQSSRIEFALPVKSKELIEYLYQKGCTIFVFDTLAELSKLEKYAPNSKKLMRLYITDIAKYSIQYGVDIHEISSVYRHKIHLVDGVAFHISENTSVKQLKEVFNRTEQAIKMLTSFNKRSRSLILNIGGGFSYQAESGYYEYLTNILKKTKEKYDINIISEPGTIIVRTAGRYITKVISIIQHEQYTEVFIDGGIPHGVIYPPENVSFYKYKKEKCKRKIYKFIDNTCMRKELFMISMLYEIEENDVLVFEHYGAYASVFQNNFHRWKRANVIYISENE